MFTFPAAAGSFSDFSSVAIATLHRARFDSWLIFQRCAKRTAGGTDADKLAR
jgi:hypothetical protein